jgi:hypothetical protein
MWADKFSGGQHVQMKRKRWAGQTETTRESNGQSANTFFACGGATEFQSHFLFGVSRAHRDLGRGIPIPGNNYAD